MSRIIHTGVAQLGPIARIEDRESVVQRLLGLLHEARSRGCNLLVFPELALTSFFPRWWIDDQDELDSWFEKEMPSSITRPLFEHQPLGVAKAMVQFDLDLERFYELYVELMTRQASELSGLGDG